MLSEAQPAPGLGGLRPSRNTSRSLRSLTPGSRPGLRSVARRSGLGDRVEMLFDHNGATSCGKPVPNTPSKAR